MIAVEDIAYIRIGVDDLNAQERFLLDFGMRPAGRTECALYMRGAGPQPVVHISELRTADHRPSIGLVAATAADLDVIASELSATVEDNPEPGGGRIVRVRDPSGIGVEILHRPAVDPLAVREVKASNFGVERAAYGRFNARQKFDTGPSHVLRLGHVAMIVQGCDQTFAWYARHFNFKVSDRFHAREDVSRSQVIFARCGLGQTYTDHHTLALIDASAFPALPAGTFDHSAYEVLDWDDLMIGHDHLGERGYAHAFGIGRHVAGGMIFDYWRDTAGHKVEHWADGDHVNDDYEVSEDPIGSVPFKTWGPEPLPGFLAPPEPAAAT